MGDVKLLAAICSFLGGTSITWILPLSSLIGSILGRDADLLATRRLGHTHSLWAVPGTRGHPLDLRRLRLHVRYWHNVAHAWSMSTGPMMMSVVNPGGKMDYLRNDPLGPRRSNSSFALFGLQVVELKPCFARFLISSSARFSSRCWPATGRATSTGKTSAEGKSTIRSSPDRAQRRGRSVSRPRADLARDRFDPLTHGDADEHGLMQVRPDVGQMWAKANKVENYRDDDSTIPRRTSAWAPGISIARSSAGARRTIRSLLRWPNITPGANALKWVDPLAPQPHRVSDRITFPSTRKYVEVILAKRDQYRKGFANNRWYQGLCGVQAPVTQTHKRKT